VKKIAKKMFTRKKMILLGFLLLLVCVAWVLRVRGRTRKG